MDDLTTPGKFGTDVHNSYVFDGNKIPDYAGAQPPNHVYRLTPEFYYGLSDTLELGLYTLTSTSPGADVNFDGAKLRAKFIAPHDNAQGSFWGANFELGRIARRFSQDPWTAQLKGIYGFRGGRWTFAVNPNLDGEFSGPVSIPVTVEVDSKLAYKTGRGYQIGAEAYDELGPLRSLGRLTRQSQILYGIVNSDLGKLDLNIGVGRGLTTVSDRWVLKFIVGFRY